MICAQRHRHAPSGERRGTFLYSRDIARFEDSDVHGLRNDGPGEFAYLSVTAPPIDCGYAYHNEG